MGDLISRSSLFNRLATLSGKSEIFSAIQREPEVDAVPADYFEERMKREAAIRAEAEKNRTKPGRWRRTGNERYGDFLTCSECGCALFGTVVFVGVDGDCFSDIPISFSAFKQMFCGLWKDGENE